jgi:membrane protein YdbS with pleckstrin-like domain
MSWIEITLGIVFGLVVNEFSDVSPWLGRLLVAWSARLQYGDNARAEIRSEELAAVINDRPGKLFKLTTGLLFLASALTEYLWRLVTGKSRHSGELPEELSSLPRRGNLPFEEEPSMLVARYLFPTEKFRGEWRRHWIHLAKSLAIIATYAVLCVIATERRIKPRYVDRMITIIVVVAVLLAAHRVLNWWLTRFVITNKRLMSSEGVLFRRIAMIPLLRVTDIRYSQTPIGRVLNYGTFTLESANRRNALRKIIHLPNPNELYLRLVEEMYEPEAVEARLSRGLYDDIGDRTSLDPATIQADVIRHIEVLNAHLTALSTAIGKLTTAAVLEPDPPAIATTSTVRRVALGAESAVPGVNPPMEPAQSRLPEPT